MPHIPVLLARFADINVVEPTEWWTRSRDRQRQRLTGTSECAFGRVPGIVRHDFGFIVYVHQMVGVRTFHVCGFVGGQRGRPASRQPEAEWEQFGARNGWPARRGGP